MSQDRLSASDLEQLGLSSDDDKKMAAGKPVTADDPDAMNEQAKVVGEEAVGGTTPTPDQSNVDDIGTAVGITPEPGQPLEVLDEMQSRDEQRFELDADSKGPGASA